MSKEFKTFQKQLSSYISSEIQSTNPMIGVIVKVTNDFQYCDIKTGDGTLINVPAHGFPVYGDSAIIHFIGGNYEQPVADCARRLPVEDDLLETFYESECFNYHVNGDFNEDKTGYTGVFDIIDSETNTNTSSKCCILRENGDYIQFNVDISNIESDYFKVQCNYSGQGSLKIECIDTNTKNIIQNIPYNMRYDYKIWTNPYGRYGWSYNKEVYPITEDNLTHTNITVKITNYSEKTKLTFDGEDIQINPSMLIDAILVYDENSDTNYYNNVKDVI